MTRKAITQAIKDAEDRRSKQSQEILTRLQSLEKHLGLIYVEWLVPAAPEHHEKACPKCGHSMNFKYHPWPPCYYETSGVVCNCLCHKPKKEVKKK